MRGQPVMPLPSTREARLMSALGQKQTSRHVRVKSVIPLKADIHQRGLHVRLVPGPDIRLPALCGDLTFHHDRSLKTFEVAKDRGDCGVLALKAKEAVLHSHLARSDLFFALMLAHQFFDFDSAFAHR
jgi:hypothetical protein